MKTDKSLEDMIGEIKVVFEIHERIRTGVDGFYINHSQRYRLFYEEFLHDLDACDDVHLMLLDMVRNAVEWGNKGNPRKYVSIRQVIGESGLVIIVEDQGEGFDYVSHFELLRRGENFSSRGKEGSEWGGGRGLKWFYEDGNIEINFNSKGNCIFGKYTYPRPLQINPGLKSYIKQTS